MLLSYVCGSWRFKVASSVAVAGRYGKVGGSFSANEKLVAHLLAECDGKNGGNPYFGGQGGGNFAWQKLGRTFSNQTLAAAETATAVATAIAFALEAAGVPRFSGGIRILEEAHKAQENLCALYMHQEDERLLRKMIANHPELSPENSTRKAQIILSGPPLDRQFLSGLWDGADKDLNRAINHLLGLPEDKVVREGQGGGGASPAESKPKKESKSSKKTSKDVPGPSLH
eukprot:s3552_g2.t1